MHVDQSPNVTDDEMSYVPADPFKLKEKGNEAFKAKNIPEAIELWKEALKAALKKSVREPSRELSDLQLVLRLNLAKGFAEEEDYCMAKEHLFIVYENQPDNKKVYYRLGELFLKLWSYDKARDIVQQGLKVFPDDPALTQMIKRIEQEERQYEIDWKKSIKKRVDLNLEDSRVDLVSPKVAKFDRSKYSDTLEDDLDKFCHDLIDWRHDASQLVPTEVQSDIDDWKGSRDWILPHNQETLKHDRTAQYMTLPFSILLALENALRSPQPLLQRRTPPNLPPLESPQVKHMPNLRSTVTEWLSRSQQPRPFTIHVVGARGDVEMECKWSAILDRLPHVDVLQVIMIGFTDPDDPYSRRLKEKGYLSPALAKKSGLRENQKFIARLFKGKYSDFLISENVQDVCRRREFIKDADKDFIEIDSEHKIPIHPVMLFDDHPLHPDLIVIPEPQLSLHFETWVPDMAQIMFSNIPTLILGHSVMSGEFASHEANHFSSILPRLGWNFILPILWNPFSLMIDPPSDIPPMPIINPHTQNIIQYKGVSGKYAISTLVQGINEDADKRHLAKLVNDSDYVTKWMLQLEKEGLDVNSTLNAHNKYINDPSNLRQAEEREKQIEQRAQEIKKQLFP